MGRAENERFSSPAHPRRHPRGSCSGAEPLESPGLLRPGSSPGCPESEERAGALLSGHQQIPSGLCRGSAGASVSRRAGGASACSLLSKEPGSAAVCQGDCLLSPRVALQMAVHLGAQGCRTVIWPCVSYCNEFTEHLSTEMLCFAYCKSEKNNVLLP